MRAKFTGRSFVYRLILGAVILAVVIPVWMSGHKPMWPVSVIAILVVDRRRHPAGAPGSRARLVAPRLTSPSSAVTI